jgi:hypothetical protein
MHPQTRWRLLLTHEVQLLDREVVGRNVLDGRWTFQIVEEFDDCYYEPVRAAERKIREQLMAGRRHVFEAEMKERRRSAGRPGHEARPAAVHRLSHAASESAVGAFWSAIRRVAVPPWP